MQGVDVLRVVVLRVELRVVLDVVLRVVLRVVLGVVVLRVVLRVVLISCVLLPFDISHFLFCFSSLFF